MWRNVTANCIEPSLKFGVGPAYPRSRERITGSSTGFLRAGRESTRSSRREEIERRGDVREGDLGLGDRLVGLPGPPRPEPDDVEQRGALVRVRPGLAIHPPARRRCAL